MADDNAPPPDDTEAGQIEQTVAGLWNALLRYVPKGDKRAEANVLASVLHFLLSRDVADERQAAIDAAYRKGLSEGEAAGRSAAALSFRRTALDHGIILADDALSASTEPKH